MRLVVGVGRGNIASTCGDARNIFFGLNDRRARGRVFDNSGAANSVEGADWRRRCRADFFGNNRVRGVPSLCRLPRQQLLAGLWRLFRRPVPPALGTPRRFARIDDLFDGVFQTLGLRAAVAISLCFCWLGPLQSGSESGALCKIKRWDAKSSDTDSTLSFGYQTHSHKDGFTSSVSTQNEPVGAAREGHERIRSHRLWCKTIHQTPRTLRRVCTCNARRLGSLADAEQTLARVAAAQPPLLLLRPSTWSGHLPLLGALSRALRLASRPGLPVLPRRSGYAPTNLHQGTNALAAERNNQPIRQPPRGFDPGHLDPQRRDGGCIHHQGLHCPRRQGGGSQTRQHSRD